MGDFVIPELPLYRPFCLLTLQQRQGPENGQVRASGIKAALNAPISCSVSQHPVQRGAEDCESGCGFSSLVMPDLCAFNFGGKIGVEE